MALADAASSNVLVVSVAPAFASRFLVPRLNRFNQRFPEIKLRIDASTGLVDLDRSDVDLAIRMGDGKWPGVRAELLLAQQVFPVCAPALAAKLKEPAEKRLNELTTVVADQIDDMISERQYRSALQSFAAMAPELESFFKDVLVNVDDESIRRNRMSLLRKVGGAVMKIADVTKIVVDRRDYRA